jgi:diguanylate cyclase (GGDEF)-like protein/PAS domain S-box-containing protein
VTDAVMLLWQDVTETAGAEYALKREVERLALAAEGAHDGLWAWDLRTREIYVTGRWKAMLGLPAHAGVISPEEWLDRVHADDVAALKAAVDAYLSDETDCVQHEHRIRHEDGTYRSFHCRGVAEKKHGRRPTRIAGSLSDVTDQALTQERLRNAVYLDPLTGLCNRAIFVEGLGQRLKECQRRRRDDRFALLYLDLDRFKVVNDSLGHLVGDELLIAVSRRLETCLREGDVLARLGGDEFAILLNGLQTEQQANVVAFRVQEALSKPFAIGGREVFASASIGIAYGLPQYGSPDEIMHDADTAMYQAKARGKARHEVFDADMDARVRDRLGLENDLRRAVDSNGFEVHYQPIVALASGMCVGFESLVRWTRNGTPVSPAIFIPIAEELGLIETLGMQVLQQACRTFAEWQRRFPDAGLDYITVNVSSRQLMQDGFLAIAEQAVRDARLKPSDLRIEITETALMTSPNDAAKVLSDLRAFGARIYLDDFGTGYSSLSHLHKLPVDALKIDRSFVRSLLLPDRPAIVESILALARTLDTSVVAEGIETEVQARELERLGCTHAQGFLFSRPLSTPAVEEMLTANRPLGPKSVEHCDDTAQADALEPYGAHSLSGFFSH